jgi:hypothetical protein
MDKIISWYSKWVNEKIFFAKYIYLWISFNWFYYENIFDSNWYKNEYKIFLNWKNDSELNQIKFIWEKYSNIFKSNSILFEEYFIFINNRNIWWVKDLRFWQNNIIKYKQLDDIKSFLIVLYQVRCNLFHWWKIDTNINDQELVKKSSEILEIFLEKILEFNKK